jgi:DNA-directed RNA polymerase subunit RPC12/RpoP
MKLFNFLKKHKCQICERRFYKVENYMHHQLLYHSNKSSYDCSNCGLKFLNMDELKDHIKRNHSYKKDKKQL